MMMIAQAGFEDCNLYRSRDLGDVKSSSSGSFEYLAREKSRNSKNKIIMHHVVTQKGDANINVIHQLRKKKISMIVNLFICCSPRHSR